MFWELSIIQVSDLEKTEALNNWIIQFLLIFNLLQICKIVNQGICGGQKGK